MGRRFLLQGDLPGKSHLLCLGRGILYHCATWRAILTYSTCQFTLGIPQVLNSPMQQVATNWTVQIWVQFSSVTQSCPTLCGPMNRSTSGFRVHHQLPEFIQTHSHRVGDAIQPSHPLLSPSPPAPNPSQHQGLFQRVNSSHEVAKVLEFQLQHQSIQWTPRTDLL